MLIEQDPHRTRVAILEDDRLAELFLERSSQRGVVGNVYKGRVNRVLPGMQAAFVDIGLERDAFLYVSDVHDATGELAAELEPSEGETSSSRPSIDELLRPGEEIVVQVVKDPMPNKGARVTSHATLPGRYLVLMPTGSHRGVSRRIEDLGERERLKELADSLPFSGGMIVRTAGEGRDVESFERDLEVLSRLWERITERADRSAAPTLLHRDLDVALRAVRDIFSREFDLLWVDGEDAYERIVEFLDQVQPALLERVRLYRQERPLFERFEIEDEIENALRPKVWLESGGYIVINPTEALVAIDVNTGRFVGRRALEETILQTNLEAVEEIVRQIRLRDLGGIIVIDLIDMVEEEHRERVFGTLEGLLRRDRTRNKVLSISEFGLVEITRKRSRANLERSLTQPCPYCAGRGRIKSPSTIVLSLRRDVLNHGAGPGCRELLLRLHPDVAQMLQTGERAVLDELERELGVTLLLQSDRSLHHECFDIVEV